MNDQGAGLDVGLGRRVLVVDDDPDFADTLCRLLILEGFEAEQAHGAAAARAALERFAAEVALVDIRMRETSGLELLADLRQHVPALSCIVMTAYASIETAIEALQKGAYDYLRKPFHTEDLLATLERCFERIALARSREQAEAALRQRNRELEEINARLHLVLGSMQTLSSCLTLRGLCAGLLDKMARNVGGAAGALYLCEGGRLVLKHSLGAVPSDGQAIGPEGAAADRLVLPLPGEGGAPFGLVVVQAAEGRPFTPQEHEFGLILASFASEAIRLVQALERLSWSEERLREIIDNSPSMISLKDLQGRFLVVNRRFEEWHGHRRDEVLGKTCEELFPADVACLYAGEFQEVVRSGQAVDDEIELTFADGSRHSLLVTKFLVLGADGRPMGVGNIATDVTDRKRAEEQLRQAQKMEALGQLTGGVAHDFNNLLAVISGNLDLIRDEFGTAPDRIELVEDAIAAVRSGAELTQRLLAVGRRQTLHPHPTDAGQLVMGMSRLLERTLGETIGIRQVLSDDLWVAVADRNQLETSLLNLAINARDAMPEGGVLTIETANAVLGDDDARRHEGLVPGPYVMIAVRDTGMGMAPEVRERAVQPFFTTKEVGQGSGLGLSMVYGFVKQSGGHLEIDSAPRQGTTVRLYLPRAAGGRASAAASLRPLPAVAGRGERILVVEDQAYVRKVATRLLARLGYEVLEATDGRTAMRLLANGPKIDLLFTDIVLPGRMSGMQLAGAALDRQPDLRVIFASGYPLNADVRAELRDGIRLVRKPYERAELARAVRAALDVTRL